MTSPSPRPRPRGDVDAAPAMAVMAEPMTAEDVRSDLAARAGAALDVVEPAAVALDSATPPAAWVERVTALTALTGEHCLPPLLADPAGAVAERGRWPLYPWAAFLDVWSLIMWAVHLEGPLQAWRTEEGLAIAGRIEGHATMLVGHSRLLATLLPGATLGGELLEQLAQTELIAHPSTGIDAAPPEHRTAGLGDRLARETPSLRRPHAEDVRAWDL